MSSWNIPITPGTVYVDTETGDTYRAFLIPAEVPHLSYIMSSARNGETAANALPETAIKVWSPEMHNPQWRAGMNEAVEIAGYWSGSAEDAIYEKLSATD